MLNLQRGSAVRVTHTPSGETVTITGDWGSSLSKMRRNALRILASWVWARRNGVERSSGIVATYELPDGDEYPHNLAHYREPPNAGLTGPTRPRE